MENDAEAEDVLPGVIKFRSKSRVSRTRSAAGALTGRASEASLHAMVNPSREMLLTLASRFRSAILKSVPCTSSLATLHDFPRGACGDASLLLAKYLQVNGCGPSMLVLGHRLNQEHAWLQLEDYLIDITADQFEDQDMPVIVSTASSWHSAFNGKINNVADFCLYHPDSAFRLTKAYQEITRCIDS